MALRNEEITSAFKDALAKTREEKREAQRKELIQQGLAKREKAKKGKL